MGALLLFVATLASAALAAAGPTTKPTAGHRAAAEKAVELTQQYNKNDRLRIVLSSVGATATEIKRGRPDAGVIVRYDDQRVVLLDYSAKTYAPETIGEATKALRRERALVKKAHAEVRFKTPSGRPEFPAPKLVPLGLHAKIAGAPAQAYLFQQKGSAVRVWLSSSLPTPPAKIQESLTGALPVPETTKGVILREEVKANGKWRVGLDTLRIQPQKLTNEDLSPPAGWKPRKPPSRRLSATPATVLRLVGPVSAAPDVFALYWNGPFSGTFVTGMNGLFGAAVGTAAPSPYWIPLGQYGVTRGSFIGSSPITFPLPTTVGTWNFFAVEAMVTAAFFVTPAPKIWWRFGDRDPILAIFVPSAAVATSGWSGYHLFGVSLAIFLPWPVSLAAHPIMPWLIVKTPGTVGGTSVSATHELVEAATDPLPLSANFDPTKLPPWVGGEIADICSVGTVSGPTTIARFGATLQTYWSNAARACVG